MPTRPKRPCLSPGCPQLLSKGSRCPAHQRQQVPTRTQRGYTNAWLRISRAAIKAQPWCSVSTCMATEDLTTDHIVPKARGGTDEPSNCQVLCRRHNSEKGKR